jgi:hypothetical protein
MTAKLKVRDDLKNRITWTEWKDQFRRARDVHTCQGLLHVGFDLPRYVDDADDRPWEEREKECILFYIELADGHAACQYAGYEKVDTVNQPLRAKAFSVLVQNYLRLFCFKSGERKAFKEMPIEIVEKLIWFLRPQKYPKEGTGLRNVIVGDKNHSMALAFEFTTDFCHYIWNESDEHRPEGCEGSKSDPRLNKFVPEVIRILNAMGWKHLFGIVPAGRRWKWWDWCRFNEPVLKELESIALAPEGFLKGEFSVELAAAHGRAAAQLLLLCRAVTPEVHKALIRQVAEARIAEGKRMLEKVSS